MMIGTAIVSAFRCRPRAATGMFVLLLGIAPSTKERAQEHRDAIEAVLSPHGITADHLRAEVIAAWNELAHDLAFAEDQFLTFKGQRSLAMMHLAMHDALNAIVPIYEPYAYSGPRGLAHPMAAAAQSAHDVLIAQYPDQKPKLAIQLAESLAQIPDGLLRDRGIELGRAVAAVILAMRVNDGWDFPGTYEFRQDPGRYQTTPPWDGFVAQPGFRFARPFVLAHLNRFRPPPPPSLRSAAYGRAFREVKDSGAAHSSRRTDEQTAYAIWWMEFAEGSVNRLARRLATDHDVHLWTAARLFAHIGVVLFDGYVVTWDSKYGYDHWRPYTAIRAADGDANPDTTPDASWESLRPAPPFPEYVSAHAAACGASFAVLAHTFGDRLPFTMETTTAPPGMPTRTFSSFDLAATECADSRVQLGWHFRYATDAGLVLGGRVARYALDRSLRPVRHREGHGRK